MKTFAQAVSIVFTATYFLILFFTNYSLTGYWMDGVCLLLLSGFTLLIVYRWPATLFWQKLLLKSAAFSLIGFFGITFLPAVFNPFSWDRFGTISFHNQIVEGRIFHAYFTPVGAYAGGEGRFWITESPSYFPLIERVKFYDRTVIWNFAAKEWDGQAVDQEEVVKHYIQTKVLLSE